MITFTEGKKRYIFILAPIILILLKLIYLIKDDLLFRFGRDETRHLLLINEISNNGIPSPSINLPGYPPALHLFFVETSIITGIDVKIVWYLFSLLLISCMIMVTWIILTKYMNIKSNFILFFGLYALLFKIPSPVPSNIVYYVQLPILTLIILRYLKYKKNIEFIPLILIMTTLTITHYSSVMFILFIMFALILFYAANIKEKILLMQCLIILIISLIGGFLVYFSLMPDLAYSIKRYFLTYTNPFVHQIIFVGIVTYVLILVYFQKIYHIRYVQAIFSNNYFNKIVDISLSISIFCIIAGILYSLIYSTAIFCSFFIEPPLPDFTINYVFNKFLRNHIPIYMLTTIGFDIFLILSIFEIKKHKVWNSSYVLVFSFIIPIFIVLILSSMISIFYDLGYLVNHIINRIPSFATMSILVVGTMFISERLNQKSDKINNVFKLLLIFSLLISFSANDLQEFRSYPIKEHTSQPLYWLVQNTDMEPNTMIPLSGKEDVYHEYYISNNYILDMGTFKIMFLPTNSGDSLSSIIYIELHNTTKIYHLPIKWSEVPVSNEDNKIFASDAINFYEKR